MSGKMDEVRMGEIALLFLKQKLRDERIHLTPNFKRQIGNTAKSVGIPTVEALVFAEIIVRELVEETLEDANGKTSYRRKCLKEIKDTSGVKSSDLLDRGKVKLSDLLEW